MRPTYCAKEMNILHKDIGILHSDQTCALEFAVLDVKVQLTATLILSLIFPINRGTTNRRVGDGDDGTLTERFRLETIDDVSNLFGHTIAVVSLRPAAFRQLPGTVFFLCTVPSHVLFRVVYQGPGWEKFRFDERSCGRNVLNDTD